jgi:hypothetical protein
LFRIGFFGYFLILPLLTKASVVNKLVSKTGYEKPSSFFVINIIVVYILLFTCTIIYPKDQARNFAELRELLYSFFIMFYVIYYILIGRAKQYKEMNSDTNTGS